MELQISPHFFYYSFNPETPIGRELLDNRWMDKTEMPERNSVTESIFYIILYYICFVQSLYLRISFFLPPTSNVFHFYFKVRPSRCHNTMWLRNLIEKIGILQ